ncbi:MAG: FAD-dependent monooxygenase [Verrucomicrobiota bacterium]|nr:FAD-dependent monooxygenase [Verrucomicrobiota bacterium]
MPNESIPLLIVGAGPVGLTMACELARHGVAFRIIDQAPERSKTSKALAIFPRTIEVFETMGVVETVLREGHRLFGLQIQNREERLAQIDFASIASPYPFVLSLAQAETERILIEQLHSLGIEVERDVTLTGLTHTARAVSASLRHSDGHDEVVETPWLLGCDGAHSATRHALELPFEGAQYRESFVLADVRVDSPLSRTQAHLFFSSAGLFAIFPLGEERARIIVAVTPENREHAQPDVTLEEIQRYARDRGPAGLQVSEPVWMSRFNISHRKVESFRKLRVFLAGDAAHIHSPAGGQGMNTGIQDSFNLAWKLALVVQGRAPVELLSSYNDEREPIAKSVLNLTDRITRVATVRNPVAQSVRNFLLPVVGQLEFVQGNIADRMTELAVNYRRSAIVEHHGGGALRAGDRAPDCDLRGVDQRAQRLFELFRDPRHVLLVFLGADTGLWQEEHAQIRALGELFADVLCSYSLVRGRGGHADGIPSLLQDVTGAAHLSYGLPTGGLMLVRPDGYIAFRCGELDARRLEACLARIFTSPTRIAVEPEAGTK